MKPLSEHITESLNNVTTKTYFIAQKAKASFVKDLKANNIKYENPSGNKFEIEDSPKASMAIKMVKERFGMNSISTKTDENLQIDESKTKSEVLSSLVKIFGRDNTSYGKDTIGRKTIDDAIKAIESKNVKEITKSLKSFVSIFGRDHESYGKGTIGRKFIDDAEKLINESFQINESKLEKGVLVRITTQESQDIYNDTWKSSTGTKYKAGETVHEIKKISVKFAEISANGPNVKIPLSDLKIEPLPYFSYHNDAKKTMTMSSRSKNNYDIYDLAVNYGMDNELISSGHEVILYYVDKDNVDAQFGRKKPKRLSLDELETYHNK